MRYDYIRISAQTPFRPYLKVHLRCGFHMTQDTLCLADTGADYAIFPMTYARELKITLDPNRLWQFMGTGGKPQEGYLHTVEMVIWDNADEGIAFRFETDVVFCATFAFPGGPLLGQEGFFTRFRAEFNQREKHFTLYP